MTEVEKGIYQQIKKLVLESQKTNKELARIRSELAKMNEKKRKLFG